MKYLLLILLLTSCATKRKVVTDEPMLPNKCENCEFSENMERCMIRFAKRGFDSEAIVRMCSKVYERRK